MFSTSTIFFKLFTIKINNDNVSFFFCLNVNSYENLFKPHSSSLVKYSKIHKKEKRPFGSEWTEMMFVLHMPPHWKWKNSLIIYLFRDGSFRSIRLLIIICLLLDTTKING